MAQETDQLAFVAAAAAGPLLALQMLRAEMEALTRLMPGLPQAEAMHSGIAHSEAPRTDAEIEAGFDNMPV